MEALCSHVSLHGGPTPPSAWLRSARLSTTHALRISQLSKPRARNAPLRSDPPPAPLAATAAKANMFDLSPPPIDHDDVMVAGPEAFENLSVGVYENDDQAIEAALNGIAVMDLSHFGRIRVTGDDRIQFLHNQTTAKFDSLSDGEGCDATFVTPTARTIDIAHAWVMKNAVVLLVSPCTCRSIIEMLNKYKVFIIKPPSYLFYDHKMSLVKLLTTDERGFNKRLRYIFYADKVEVHDMTEQTCFFVLLGPKSNQVMKTLKLDDLIGQPYGTHRHYNVNGMPITVGVGSVLSTDGFSFLLAPASAESILETLSSVGAIPMGLNAWERLRVFQGRPAPGKELTNNFNVLEAGLLMSVSLDKGCYKGQETITRLITYNGVKQRLWGLRLSGPAEPGSSIMVDGKKVGVLTSYSLGRKSDEHIGLGYVKRQVGPGAEVCIGDVVGTVIHVPFLCHSLE